MLGVLLALPGIARDFTYTYEGQTLTYTVLNETDKICETKRGSSAVAGNPGIKGNLVIPSVVKDGDVELSVCLIGDFSFTDCSITSVVIPESVDEIGKAAFSGCSGLISIVFGDALRVIQTEAFAGCTGLTTVTFPDKLIGIGGSAFLGCTGLTSINLPGYLSDIYPNAFTGCTNLANIKAAAQLLQE